MLQVRGLADEGILLRGHADLKPMALGKVETLRRSYWLRTSSGHCPDEVFQLRIRKRAQAPVQSARMRASSTGLVYIGQWPESMST